MSARGSPSGTPAGGLAALGDLLRALEPPLQYLAADGFRRLETTHLPLPALVERVARARAEGGGEGVGPLAELEGILTALGRQPAGAHVDLLRRAHALLPALRAAAATPLPWTDYRPTSAPVEPVLAALAGPVQFVRGVGPKRAAELARFGLGSVEDLLYHLPFRYEDRRALVPLRDLRVGEEATTAGEVAAIHQGVAGRRGRGLLEVVLRDGDAVALLVWFNQVQYFARRFAKGQRLVVHGRVEPPLGGGPRRLIHPDVSVLEADEDAAAQAQSR